MNKDLLLQAADPRLRAPQLEKLQELIGEDPGSWDTHRIALALTEHAERDIVLFLFSRPAQKKMLRRERMHTAVYNCHFTLEERLQMLDEVLPFISAGGRDLCLQAACLKGLQDHTIKVLAQNRKFVLSAKYLLKNKVQLESVKSEAINRELARFLSEVEKPAFSSLKV